MPAGITTTLLLAALVCAILAISTPSAAPVAAVLVGAGIVTEIVFFLLTGLVGEDEDGVG